MPPAIQKRLKVISIARAQRIYPYSTYSIAALPAVSRIEHQLPILQYFVWKTVQKAFPSISFDYHILHSKSLRNFVRITEPFLELLNLFSQRNYRKLYNSQGIIKIRLFIRIINKLQWTYRADDFNQFISNNSFCCKPFAYH